MNITAAYMGALDGLKPPRYDGRIRSLQVAICTQLALLRRARYHVQDSSFVTTGDMARLKPIAGKAGLK